MNKQSIAQVVDNIYEVLTRGVQDVLPSKEGLAKLLSERQITLYQGFDPSMPSLHLGNFTGLMKLRAFQKLGHKVIFLVGDFTGMIGDPDKISTRVPLTREQTLKNSEVWKTQASKVLAFEGENPAVMLFNSKWNDSIEFKELIEITSHFTVQQILERDMFQKRLKENRPIRLHELLYPVTQAIDSIKMVHGGVDLEIGGNDQLFNILAGRNLMKDIWKKEKYILTTKLLVDKEGNKVGKTTGNALFLDADSGTLFAGIMSFPDEVIELGFELLTELDLGGISEKVKEDPMGEKKRLAFEVTKIIHGEDEAKKAKVSFEKTFQKRDPNYTKTVAIQKSLTYTIAQEIGSNSEAKRLINQGAVDVNNNAVRNPTHKVNVGDNIKVGEKIFLKVVEK